MILVLVVDGRRRASLCPFDERCSVATSFRLALAFGGGLSPIIFVTFFPLAYQYSASFEVVAPKVEIKQSGYLNVKPKKLGKKAS